MSGADGERIVRPDESVRARARARIDALTKPVGSLGRIEELAVQLCAIAGEVPPPTAYERRTVIVAAGDHGVADEGVSAYPAEVTAQMVGGFLGGIAAISTFARAVRAEVFVANFGVRTPLAPHERLVDAQLGAGTANLAREPAIAPARVDDALAAGARVFADVAARAPFDVLALGEMGIANTTSASAIVAALAGAPASEVVGRGTGIDDARLAKKIAVVDAALARARGSDWRTIASEAGGWEILGLAGIMLAAARARVPIVLDGFIVTAAALLARGADAAVADYCIASHRSRERGHAVALDALGLRPLFDLDLALGEASGAVLALPLIEAAARMVREMRTFAEAGVATKEDAT